jgi:hypothetical protein
MRGMIRRAVVVAGPVVVMLGLAAGAASASGAASWSPITSPGIFSYDSSFNNGQPMNPGQAFSQKFTLTNSGSSATSALKITLTPAAGTPASAFAASHDACTGTSLGPKKSCTITVTYTAPGAPGQTQQATLTATGPKPAVAAASVTLTGTVAVPHTAPVLANIETSPLAYSAGSAPVAVTSTLTVSSADATTLVGAAVTVSSGLAASEDSLGFTNQNGISGSYDAATGVLTLTGTASLSNYQMALRSVTYADSNAAAAASTRAISFQVNDGAAANNLSNIVSRTVSVANVAATSLQVSGPASVTAGEPATFTVTALDASHNVATGYTGTVHFTSTDPQATLPANSTLTNGVGTFTVSLKTAGNQEVFATDTVNSGITGATPVAVNPAAPVTLIVSVQASAATGQPIPFTVTALDQFGNVATGYSGTVHFTSTDPQATLPANSTLTNGVGTFTVSFSTPGNQTVTATDTVNGAINGTSGTVNVVS